MKKIIFTAFCTLISFLSFSQQISIQLTISDSLTKEYLPFATVYLKHTGIGTTTNFDGKAKLKLKSRTLYFDTLICSYIGYQTKKIPIALSKSTNLKIFLPQSLTELSEFVITYKKPLTTKQILKKAIKNTSKNYSNIPVNLNGLYRETLKEDEKYIYLNEAVVNIHYSKYQKNKLDKKIWKDWYYDDSYAFEFKGGWFFEFPTHFNTKQDKVKLIEARTSENWSQYNFDNPINGGPLSLTSKDFIKYKYDFLNPNNFNKYTYNLKENELVNNHSCYVLHFYPNETNRKMVFDMGKKMKRSIYVGKIYIEMGSFAIVKMEFQLAKNVDFGFYKYHVPLNDIVIVDYQEYESTWYLKKITRTKTRSIKPKSSPSKLLYKSTQELIIINVNRDSVIQFTENEVWKHTKLTTLRNREVPYNSEFWKEYKKRNYPVLLEKIKHDLEIKIPLEKQFNNRFKQKEDIPIPKTKKVDFVFDYPFEKLSDSYQWFANSTQQTELYSYLEKENQFADNYIIPYKNYQKNYFNSLNNFYPKDTSEIKHNYKKGSLIYEEDSIGNTILYEYSDSINRTSILNLTKFQDNRRNCYVTSVKTHNTKIGISYTNNGGLNNYLIVLTKENLIVIDSISDVYSYEWFTDSVFFYTKNNTTKRSDKLFKHDIISKRDSLILFEKDVTYDISLSNSKSYIICTIQSIDESEIYLIKKDERNPPLELIQARQTSIKYSVKEINNKIYLLTNEKAINNRVLVFNDNNSWKELIPHSKDILITDFVITENYFVIKTYQNSFLEIKYKKKNDSKWKQIDFKTKMFNADIRLIENDKIKIYFSKPNTPFIQYQFDLSNGILIKIKTAKIKRRIAPQYFKTERLWAKSKDGIKIPITLTKSISPKKKHKGLILKAYGAYGNYPMGSGFNAEDAILLNDGFTIAYAHIRGSITMGNQWYLDGKLLNKENSFNDYIACAEYLIKKKITNPEHLIGYGNSAGGLIMGAVINRRPELFNTVILDHPYLDVLTTMMNDSLPLTTDEFKEWGNPKEKETYEYIKGYSPYQNIKKQRYPNLLFIASANDFQAPVWQIAKYVAKLREYNTGNNTILFKTDIGSGHIGNTSGKEWIKNLSFQYAYIYGNIFE